MARTLEGLTVVVTGTLNGYTRDGAKEAISVVVRHLVQCSRGPTLWLRRERRLLAEAAHENGTTYCLCEKL